MRFKFKIQGLSPVIMHNGATGIDPTHPANIEKKLITKKKASTRTESDEERLVFLECQTSFWLDEKNLPCVPAPVIRANLETAARRLREGQAVREGLIVESTSFEYDEKKYGKTLEKLSKTCQFTVGVVVQRSRLLRTRAKFDLPWAIEATVYVDQELVDKDKLETWLDIGGRRIGIGDWRPEKSGHYGRYEMLEIEKLKT